MMMMMMIMIMTFQRKYIAWGMQEQKLYQYNSGKWKHFKFFQKIPGMHKTKEIPNTLLSGFAARITTQTSNEPNFSGAVAQTQHGSRLSSAVSDNVWNSALFESVSCHSRWQAAWVTATFSVALTFVSIYWNPLWTAVTRAPKLGFSCLIEWANDASMSAFLTAFWFSCGVSKFVGN